MEKQLADSTAAFNIFRLQYPKTAMALVAKQTFQKYI